MSNQTKIGLLLGLGVVLLVGIIISDHLATQSQSNITDSAATLVALGERNPTGQPDKNRQTFFIPVPDAGAHAGEAPIVQTDDRGPVTAMVFNSEPTAPSPLIANGPDAAPPQQLVAAAPTVPETPRMVLPAPAPATAVVAAMRTYTVKTGDTLSVIAANTLGSRNRWQEILDANKQVLTSPKALRVGTVLSIPGSGAAAAVAQAPAPTAAPVVARTYTVKKGDLLGTIAARELGSSRRVKDLVVANKKTLPRGEKTMLRVGMTLNIPAQ